MRIAYITRQMPYGFEEPFFEPELRSLAKHYDVVVIPTRPPLRRICYRDLGVTPHHLALFDAHVAVLALRELRRDPRAVAAAFRAVFGPRYRLRSKLVNLVVFPKALALAHEVRQLRIEHIHAQWLTTPATAAYVASLLTDVPFSISVHQHDVFADNLVPQKVERAVFVRVISVRNLRHLQERLSAELAARCSLVHLGVEIPPAIAEPPARIPRLLCPARLCIWKGHRYLLAALAELRDRGIAFTCDLAGNGELRAAVKRGIAELRLGECVKMLGNVPHDALQAALAHGEYDLVALASTERAGEHEGIPVAIMESMAAGVPVVATQTGSLDELVDRESGILVPQRDPASLAGEIERLLRDPALRRRMGLCGRERVIAEFDTSATTARLAALIAGGATEARANATACAPVS